MRLTRKQISRLKVLSEKGLIIASWSESDLSDLQRFGLASSASAYLTTGKLSSSKVWCITVDGKSFLQSERGES